MKIVSQNKQTPFFHNKSLQVFGESLLYNFLDQNQLSKLFDEFSPYVSMQFSNENYQSLLIYKQKNNATPFIYDMFHKWFVPGRLVEFDSFIHLDFSINHTDYTLCFLTFPSSSQVSNYQMDLFKQELKFGLVSCFQAQKILEIKGISHEEKLLMLQERVWLFLHKFPRLIEIDVIPFLQSIFSHFSDVFKCVRPVKHLSSVALSLYVLYKKQKLDDKFPLVTKVTKKTTEDAVGKKDVICVSCCLSHLHEDDFFQIKDLMSFFALYFPQIQLVEHSFFLKRLRREGKGILYFELERKDRQLLSKRDLEFLKELTPNAIKKGICHFNQPFSVPVNEEERLKNMIQLGSEMQTSQDLPQVMISFQNKTREHWLFSVLLVSNEAAFHKLMQACKSSPHQLIIEKTKLMGFLDDGSQKEGTILRVSIPLSAHSNKKALDFYDARERVCNLIQEIIGPFRDYNGGMIQGQMAKLTEIKSLIALDDRQEYFLDKFFLGIIKKEYLAIWQNSALIMFFSLFQHCCSSLFSIKEKIVTKMTNDLQIYICLMDNLDEYNSLKQRLMSIDIPSHEFLIIGTKQINKYLLGVMVKKSKTAIEVIERTLHLS